MKTLAIKFLTAALLVAFTGAGAFAQIKKIDIIATGLTCSMCSNAINKQLQSMPEVDHVTTDLNTSTFSVFFKKNAVVRPVELKNAVEQAGFFIGTMNLTMKVDPDKVDAHSMFRTEAGTFVFIDRPIADREAQYRVLDKGFVTQREYKEIADRYKNHPSFSVENENDYHLTAVK